MPMGSGDGMPMGSGGGMGSGDGSGDPGYMPTDPVTMFPTFAPTDSPTSAPTGTPTTEPDCPVEAPTPGDSCESGMGSGMGSAFGSGGYESEACFYDMTNCCGNDYYLTEAECTNGVWQVLVLDPEYCSAAGACPDENSPDEKFTTSTSASLVVQDVSAADFGDDEKEAFCDGVEVVIEMAQPGIIASCVVDDVRDVVDGSGDRRRSGGGVEVDFTTEVTAQDDAEFDNGIDQAQAVNSALKDAVASGELEIEVNSKLSEEGSQLVVDFDESSLEAQTRVLVEDPPAESGDDTGANVGLIVGVLLGSAVLIGVAVFAVYKFHITKKTQDEVDLEAQHAHDKTTTTQGLVTSPKDGETTRGEDM